jgi:hypothetical protein
MKKVLALFIFLFIHTNSFASDLKYEVIVSDIEVPWSFTFLPDSSILITWSKIINLKINEDVFEFYYLIFILRFTLQA